MGVKKIYRKIFVVTESQFDTEDEAPAMGKGHGQNYYPNQYNPNQYNPNQYNPGQLPPGYNY